MARATFAAALAAALLTTAGAHAADRSPDAQRAGSPAPAAQDQAITAAEFIRHLTMTDLLEVELGELAMRRGEHGEIKGFGQMLATDHGKSQLKLKALLRDRDVVPTALDPDHASVVAALRDIPDEQFDRKFIEVQIAAHRRAIAMLERYAEHGDVPALRAFARDSLSPNRHHLEVARRLAQGYDEWKG